MYPPLRYELSIHERLAVCKLMKCRMWEGHFKFIDTLNNIRKANGEVTAKQRQALRELVIRYRKQFRSEAEKTIVNEVERVIVECGVQGKLFR